MARKQKITVGDIIYRFLASQGHLADGTLKWYRTYLLPFAKRFGKLPYNQITPSIMQKWVSAYSEGAQHGAARSIVRAFNWAVDERLIDSTPIRGYRKPPQTRRESAITLADYAHCLRAARETQRVQCIRPLKDAIKFLHHTGCRPQELRIIESRWIEGRKIVIPKKLSKGKRKCRVIYLDDMAAAIAARLAKQHPQGPIFRNSRGNPWAKDALSLAFRRLRKRTGIKGLVPYSFRHLRITRWLEQGKDVATIAALAGNSPRMVLDVYNHVANNEDRLLGELD
jgi:integrase